MNPTVSASLCGICPTSKISGLILYNLAMLISLFSSTTPPAFYKTHTHIHIHIHTYIHTHTHTHTKIILITSISGLNSKDNVREFFPFRLVPQVCVLESILSLGRFGYIYGKYECMLCHIQYMHQAYHKTA